MFCGDGGERLCAHACHTDFYSDRILKTTYNFSSTSQSCNCFMLIYFKKYLKSLDACDCNMTKCKIVQVVWILLIDTLFHKKKIVWMPEDYSHKWAEDWKCFTFPLCFLLYHPGIHSPLPAVGWGLTSQMKPNLLKLECPPTSQLGLSLCHCLPAPEIQPIPLPWAQSWKSDPSLRNLTWAFSLSEPHC